MTFSSYFLSNGTQSVTFSKLSFPHSRLQTNISNIYIQQKTESLIKGFFKTLFSNSQCFVFLFLEMTTAQVSQDSSGFCQYIYFI